MGSSKQSSRPAPSPVLTVMLAVLLVAGCGKEERRKGPVVRPVKTMVLGAPGTGITRTFPGKVEASKKVEMAFKVAGPLIEFPVKEGQKVSEGELLARIDPRDFATRLKSAESRLEEARAQLAAMEAGARPEERRRLAARLASTKAEYERALADYKRNKQLLEKRTISRADFDTAEATMRVAKGNYEEAYQENQKGLTGSRKEDIDAKKAEIKGLEASVKEAKDALEDTELRAPYDGAVAQTFVENFENVREKQSILKFQDIDEIEIVVDVPEQDIYPRKKGDISRVVAWFPALSEDKFEVKLTEFRTEADPATQTYQAKLTMQVPEDQHILPGTSAIVKVELNSAVGEQLDRFSIPLSAVVDPGGNNPAVWVVDSEMKVHRREVTVGAMAGENIEITGGLKSKERIATAGANQLEEGMQVRSLDGGTEEPAP